MGDEEDEGVRESEGLGGSCLAEQQSRSLVG